MTDISINTHKICSASLEAHLAELCDMMLETIADGAAISFMASFTYADAKQFWLEEVKRSLVNGDRHLFGTLIDNRLAGTVQLITAMPPNQPHRAEIAKMMVHPDYRRRGVGNALMRSALTFAKEAGKTLVTLDTRTGDIAEKLYRGVGFKKAGVIPDFALDPDGQARHATTYMYRTYDLLRKQGRYLHPIQKIVIQSPGTTIRSNKRPLALTRHRSANGLTLILLVQMFSAG